MKKEIEVSAKTKEEAIAEAVEKLGAPNEAALVITVVNEGRKGFLGFGAVNAVIKAVYQIPDAPAEGQPRREKGSRGRGDRTDRGSRSGNRGNRQNKKPAAEEMPAEEISNAPVRQPVTPIDPATATESEQMAYAFMTKLVADMGLEGVTVAMHPGDNDDMVITVDGESAGVLIGHHGDTLDALQYLANLAANRKEEGEKREFARITVDVESYRAKREDALRSLARKKANQVLKYKKSVMLEPMNPYERRIIHSEIQHIAGVSTNSIGVENNRRVVIYLEEEGMPTAGIKATGSASGEKSGHSRNRRRRSGRGGGMTHDPLATAHSRQPLPSTFSDDDVKDPFDIDLSAATYQEEDSDYEAADTASSDVFDAPSIDVQDTDNDRDQA